MSELFTVRASSWGALFDCPHKWEGTHILGMYNPSGMRALLGTAIHASTAAFDQGRMDHANLTADDTAGVLVDTIQNPEFEVDRAGDDLTNAQAESIGLRLHTKYCLDISPRYQFKAVEMPTKPFIIDCGNGVSIELTGTMDRSRVVQGAEGVGISDLKSGAAAVQKGAAKTKGHQAQIGTYELLYEHTTGERVTEPGEIIGFKTKGTPEIATGLIKHAREVMVGDDEHRGLLEFAAQMFKSGLFPPNPQTFLCSAKYCARYKTCFYRDR